MNWHSERVKRAKASRVFKVTKTGKHYRMDGWMVSRQEVTPKSQSECVSVGKGTLETRTIFLTTA